MDTTVAIKSSGNVCEELPPPPSVYGETTGTAISLGITNIYEETNLPCHQSGSLAFQGNIPQTRSKFQLYGRICYVMV